MCVYIQTLTCTRALSKHRDARHLGASVSLQHNTRAVLFTSVALAIFGLIKSIVQSWDKSQRGINNAHIRVHTAGGEGEGRAEPFVSLALSRATQRLVYILRRNIPRAHAPRLFERQTVCFLPFCFPHRFLSFYNHIHKNN